MPVGSILGYRQKTLMKKVSVICYQTKKGYKYKTPTLQGIGAKKNKQKRIVKFNSLENVQEK